LPVETSEHCFEVFSCIDESLDEEPRAGGYTPDAVIGRFTGLSIEAIEDLRHITAAIPRPPGNNTIRRWGEVFA